MECVGVVSRPRSLRCAWLLPSLQVLVPTSETALAGLYGTEEKTCVLEPRRSRPGNHTPTCGC